MGLIKKMNQQLRSIRPFIGARDYELSRSFYSCMGFNESVIDVGMSLFTKDDLGFYLQKAYVKEWIENSMIFMEISDLDLFLKELLTLNLIQKFPTVRISGIKDNDWGREFFVHDPSGILWHFGQFKRF